MSLPKATRRRFAPSLSGALFVSLWLAACGSKELFVGDGSDAAGASGSGRGGTGGSGGSSGGAGGAVGGGTTGGTAGSSASGTGGSGGKGGTGTGASGGTGGDAGTGGTGGTSSGTGGEAGGGDAGSGGNGGASGTGGTASGGTGGVDCMCVKGAYVPVCGTDGTTYDAACGTECVPVEIACQGQCPCADGCSAQSIVAPDGCVCFQDSDCADGERCYGADCVTPAPGTCRAVPSTGCFGDADCPSGQLCTGGAPAPCGTTIADRVGSCAPEACPEGDCDSPGPTCTCRDDSQFGACIEASGPVASGYCRKTDGTCSGCRCASPDTLIATPDGERPIASLAVGDLVYSEDGEQIRAVPIARINRVPASHHRVLRVRFTNGEGFEMSPGHPLADGHPLSSLSPGSSLMGGTVASVETIPYEHSHTYDILPASSSGTYFASGVLVGSTLFRK